MKAQISKIKITERIRKEITKIDELAADISAYGLLNPITVMALDDGEYRLLAGLRRLKAVEKLEHSEIAINVVSPANAEAELRIEIAENEQREPFTFSEKMDFARLLEEIEREKAKERLHAGQSLGGKTAGNGRTKKESCSVFPGTQSNSARSRDLLGPKIGMSGGQYQRAKYIADNAPADIIEELDKGNLFIRPTYEKLRAKEKAEKAKDSEDSASQKDEIVESVIKPANTMDADAQTPAPISVNADTADETDEDEEYEEISAAPVQNFNKPTSAELTFGSTRRGDEDSKEYRDDLREIRDNVKLRAEHAKTHKRTIEEFQQVFRGNAEKFITILEHQIKFMDAEIWTDENNKKIARDLIDEVVRAINNFKEEF